MEFFSTSGVFISGFIFGSIVCLMFWNEGNSSRARKVSRQNSDLNDNLIVRRRLEQFDYFMKHIDRVLEQLQSVIGLGNCLIKEESQKNKTDLETIVQSAVKIHRFLSENLLLHQNDQDKEAATAEVKSLTTPVLIVDDQDIIRRTARTMLELLGFNCIEARSGEEALEVFQKNPCGLVFMDFNMPGMDGCSTAEEIRKLPQGKEAKIVVVTAKARRQDKEDILNRGINGYISKPFKVEDIERIVTRFYSLPTNSRADVSKVKGA